MQKTQLNIIFLFFLCFQINQLAVGQILFNVNGNWDFTIPNNDLTEAGLNFTGTYSSNNNQVTIDIQKSGFFANYGNYGWRVDIRKADIDWHPNLQIYARRTGIGNPFFFFGTQGNINGGNSYRQITTSNQTFFSGTRTTTGIPIQYQITGVSLLLPAKTYETTIIYTVTEQ